MYRCESWTIKKADHWRIDVFELWCWGRLLKVPWTERRSNQSTLKEINPEYSLEGPMLKLKLQYFGHLMWRTDSLEKTLMLGKIEGLRAGGQGETEDEMVRWHHQLNGHEFEQTSGDSEGQGSLGCCSPWGLRVWHDLATEQQQMLDIDSYAHEPNGNMLLDLRQMSHIHLAYGIQIDGINSDSPEMETER